MQHQTSWTILCPSFIAAVLLAGPGPDAAASENLSLTTVRAFLSQHCGDCHAGGADEGGFDLDQLGGDADDPATFARWERIFDRMDRREMPPPDAEPLSVDDLKGFLDQLGGAINDIHHRNKGTAYRRLNRQEYQNTLNDLFGTHLDLQTRLPADGRSREFDNVGEALGISVTHLQQYLDAAEEVLAAATEPTLTPPPAQTITASYDQTREGEKFIGKVWQQLPDGAVVFYEKRGYPSGMLRGTEVKPPGRYRIRVIGYAHRSDRPITLRVGGTSFARGSEKVTYGYVELPPGSPDGNDPASIELEAWIADRYMIELDPWGIDTGGYNVEKEGFAGYEGPGAAILSVELTGPLREEFPSCGHRMLYEDFDLQPKPNQNRWAEPELIVDAADPAAAARSTLMRVANAAFRRPVQSDEVDRYIQLFEQQLGDGATIRQSLWTAVSAVLCSPDFLYFNENVTNRDDRSLDDHALASRLSYFLTRTAPDEPLRRAADRHELTGDPQNLWIHARRLLDDPRSDRFITDFCDAWLNLRDIDATSPDQSLFPEYDEYLQHSMLAETRRFVRTLFDENLPVANLVDSDFAILNDRLAEHYEIEPVVGPELRKVPLPADSIRGGLLTQGSILKVSANGTNTSPVVRGVWVMERLLGNPPQPPPPGIPGVEPDVRGATTLRELLDQHRDMDSCRSCHSQIDPPGFAMECFDPIGGYRERFRSLGAGDKVDVQIAGRKVRYRSGPPVDASGQLADGRRFDDFQTFRDLLAADQSTLATTLATKLLTFATGREMGFSDRPIIERIVAATEPEGYRAGDLLRQVILSETFANK